MENQTLYKSFYESPLGRMVLLGHDDVLTDLYFLGEAHSLENLDSIPRGELSVFQDTEAWLSAYFKGKNTDSLARPSLEMKGTDFQKRVWHYIAQIPYGHFMTYGEIAHLVARDMGKARMSAQAVGGATGRNPISLIIPCHRVLGVRGALTGYGGGVDRKVWLLNLECIAYK